MKKKESLSENLRSIGLFLFGLCTWGAIVIIGTCLILYMVGYEPSKGFKINVNKLPEGHGTWTILTTNTESRYFYTIHFSDKEFIKLWRNGYDFSLLPQKEFDSSGEGKRIMGEN